MPSKIGRVIFRSVPFSPAVTDAPASVQALGLEGSLPHRLHLKRPSQAPCPLLPTLPSCRRQQALNSALG